jgi:hypothetical protein
VYAAFISVFALDAWGTGAGFWEALAAFIVHLMPTYFVLAALIIAWKRPRVGGILFIILATVFGAVFGRGDPVTLLLMALVPTAIGLLFMCDGCLDKTVLQPRI